MSKIAEVVARVEAEENENDATANEARDGSSTVDSANEVATNEAGIAGDNDGAGVDASAAIAPATSVEPSKSATSATAVAAVKTPEEDRRASQFAALKREKTAALNLREQAETRAREVASKEAALASKEADLASYLDNPTKLFEHLEKRHGIRTVDDLRRYADPAWKPAPQAAPVRDEDKPLTRA